MHKSSFCILEQSANVDHYRGKCNLTIYLGYKKLVKKKSQFTMIDYLQKINIQNNIHNTERQIIQNPFLLKNIKRQQKPIKQNLQNLSQNMEEKHRYV